MAQRKLSLIQTFRGLAAVLVLLFHGTGMGYEYLGYEYMGNIFSAGWIGVDFFFVLSGFIIFYIHYKDIGKPERVKSFYLKRFIRVYPVYWIMTVVIAGLFFVVPSWGAGYERNVDVIVTSILLFPHTRGPIVGVGWTLVFEVFFYLIFSSIILLKPRYSMALIVSWMVGIVVIATGMLNVENHYLKFIFHQNNLEFILGCAVAYTVIKTNFKLKFSILTLGLLFFSCGWVMLLNGYIQKATIQSVLILGISCAAIILSAAIIDLNRNIKIPQLLLIVGDASYSIYLTHFYTLVFFYKLLTKFSRLNLLGGFATVTLALILACALGIFFHLVIEKPLLEYFNKKWMRKSKPFTTQPAQEVASA